jgi:hypothetical protein
VQFGKVKGKERKMVFSFFTTLFLFSDWPRVWQVPPLFGTTRRKLPTQHQPTNNTPTMTDALSLLPVGALFVAIWVAGELFGLVRAPLVGQIVVGLLLGPGLLDLVPHSEAFELVGLVGLLLLVEGGGLHMDLNTLRVVGWRAVGVGLTGTALPVLAGWGLFLLLGFDSTTGYAAIFLIF